MLGRSFDDMSDKEKELCDNLAPLLEPLAKNAFYDGIDIGMFCTLVFDSAEKEYLKNVIKYRNENISKEIKEKQ